MAEQKWIIVETRKNGKELYFLDIIDLGVLGKAPNYAQDKKYAKVFTDRIEALGIARQLGFGVKVELI